MGPEQGRPARYALCCSLLNTVEGTAHQGTMCTGRVWDLRIGRSIITLQGHVKGVLALDWSPNGYMLASGSEDHTCRVWDLRTRKCTYTLPCHQSLVSQVSKSPEMCMCHAEV